MGGRVAKEASKILSAEPPNSDHVQSTCVFGPH
jgi:hypothetical protein